MIKSEVRHNLFWRVLGICFLIWIALSVAFLSEVSALGITPGRTSISYEPSLVVEVPFSLVNTEQKEMDVVFFVQGKLNQSVTLSHASASFSPTDVSKSLRYQVQLPDKLEPGLHTADIIALELPQPSEQGTYVGATVAVATQLYVYVPYPGKYVDINFNVLDSEENATATFIIPVVSRGKVGIADVRAIIDIYNELNEKVGSIETDFSPLVPGARTELSAKWPVEVNAGTYYAKVTVFYDDESRSIEQAFDVGMRLLSIESILVNDFTLGEIAKLQILVENRWREELQNVFANMLVYDYNSGVMADVKSSQENIPPLSRTELLAYWDTFGVQEGEYDGKLVVHYNEKTSDKNLLLKIRADSLDITGVGYAIRGERGGGFSLTTLLTTLVIILIIVNIGWFVFFRRYNSKEKKKGVA